jgi:hypothetical protein
MVLTGKGIEAAKEVKRVVQHSSSGVDADYGWLAQSAARKVRPAVCCGVKPVQIRNITWKRQNMIEQVNCKWTARHNYHAAVSITSEINIAENE